MQTGFIQLERTIIQALRNQLPLRDLPGVRIRALRERPKERFDVSFELRSGKSSVVVFGEIKPAVSPKILEEIAPWIRRMKALREDVAFALICPVFSDRSQRYCIENGIDFLDMAGNISVNVPGTFTLQRLGIRRKEQSEPEPFFRNINVFSARSSRVLRVLLEKPRSWTLTQIAKEIAVESERLARVLRNQKIQF